MQDVWFHIFASLSIVLIIASFILPPTGIIDNSIFMAVGELFGFGTLWEAHVAIRKGLDAKVTHNNTTIEINNDNEDEIS